MKRRAKGAALVLASIASLCLTAAADEPAQPQAARYMALKGGQALGRSGPGRDQPVEWIYQRAGLPMRILGADGQWRRVEDPGGAQTWMHESSLEDRRTVFVVGDRLGSAAMRRSPQGDGRTQAYLERGVIADLEACRGAWRRVSAQGHTGWVAVDKLWGAEACG